MVSSLKKILMMLAITVFLPGAVLAESLQTPGKLYNYSSHYWPRFKADQRSFRLQGSRQIFYARSNSYPGGYKSRTRWINSNWIKGSSIGTGVSSTARRSQSYSYGRRSNYTSRERIISWREYSRYSPGSRGVTISNPR